LTYKVVFSPEVENDLLELYLYIAERTGDVRALAYIERLERYCKGFEDFPERGTSRDDLFPGLRGVGAHREIVPKNQLKQSPDRTAHRGPLSCHRNLVFFSGPWDAALLA